jgi:hypothetical protein
MLKSSSNCNYNIPLILSVTFPELTSISLTFLDIVWTLLSRRYFILLLGSSNDQYFYPDKQILHS